MFQSNCCILLKSMVTATIWEILNNWNFLSRGFSSECRIVELGPLRFLKAHQLLEHETIFNGCSDSYFVSLSANNIDNKINQIQSNSSFKKFLYWTKFMFFNKQGIEI